MTQKLIASLLALSLFVVSGCSSLTKGLPFVDDYDDDDYYDDYDWDDDYYYDYEVSATEALNSYIDLINDGYDQVSYVDDNLYYYLDDLEWYSYDPSYDYYFSCYFSLWDKENLFYSAQNPSTTELTDAEKASLVAAADEAIEHLESVEELCYDLDKYVTAQDYKDDNFAESDDISLRLGLAIDDYYDAHDTLLDLVEELFAAYDTWEVDPNDPVSVAQGYMRDSLAAADAALDLVEVAYEADDLSNVDEVQAAYDELSGMLETHQAQSAAIGDLNYYYDSYYNSLDSSFLPVLKRTIRSMQNGDLEQFYYDYDDLIYEYNWMIDDYNYFLDDIYYYY